MLERHSSTVWKCARCRGYAIPTRAAARRGLATAQSLWRPFSPSCGRNHDDDLLREIFDSGSAWKAFRQRSDGHRGRATGLFGIDKLDRPDGFEGYASDTLSKCKRLVTRISGYNTVEQYRGIVKDLDRLSDLLCRVIDLCEFVRSTHPDERMQNAATKAYMMMFQYMNVLNTTPELNVRLDEALGNPQVVAAWSEQERQVAQILSKDFSKSAIDLPETDRDRFVELSDAVSRVGSEFMDAMEPARPYMDFPSSSLRGMDPTVVRRYSRWGRISLPSVGAAANLALRSVEDPEVRREIYMANRSASKSSITKLEELLDLRLQLARLSGFDSFAHMTLSDKMAKTPEAVNKFLNALHQQNRSIAGVELAEIRDMKTSEAVMKNFPDQLNAWDREYYTARIVASMEYRSRNDQLSAFFSLGSVVQGLSRLFDRLYGIRLVPRETSPGEVWDPDVRRLDVIDGQEGHIAVVYCDLFQRAGKNPNPAHFTVRCSRRISREEQDEAGSSSDSDGGDIRALSTVANDGLSVGVRDTPDGRVAMQLPTIALICDFAYQRVSTSAPERPALLSFREVQTLFHEMGHALHSICGRTALQNVSGTRCATDFAELPSVLMEHFAGAPEVLSLYARHWETGKALDPSLVRERLDVDKRMQGAEIEGQVLMSLLDQAYHARLPTPTGPGIDSTKIYHDVWDKYSGVPEPAGTTWQGFFGHLVGYGATYYAYLFDRVIAGKIWRDVFQRTREGAVDPAAGALFRREVL